MKLFKDNSTRNRNIAYASAAGLAIAGIVSYLLIRRRRRGAVTEMPPQQPATGANLMRNIMHQNKEAVAHQGAHSGN